MPNLTSRPLNYMQRRELERFGHRIARFGVNYAVVDAEAQVVVVANGGAFDSDPTAYVEAGQSVLDAVTTQVDELCEETVWQFTDTRMLLAVSLCSPPGVAGRRSISGAVIVDLGMPSPGQVYSETVGLNRTGSTGTQVGYLSEMLLLLAQNFQTAARTEEQMENMGTELSQVYEELVLLHKISTNMKVTESDSNFLQLACDSLTDIVQVEGIAILLEREIDGTRNFVVTAGSGLIDLDNRLTAVLHSRLIEEIHNGQEALLDSDADMPFRYDWPQSIKSIIAVPLCTKDTSNSRTAGRVRQGVSLMGYMVAVNRLDKPDFDSIDMKLFTSVASGCAVFIENGRLFKDLKELFVGSLRALTNSIDAKDPYTRGHSERVAIISRWLAERVAQKQSIDEEQIHRVYLAGLLHDIGKIGIDESVLRKNGRLTDEERECIQCHPGIGGGILRGIKQMRDIISGVLCHHERIDGKGYPEGLTGDEIPLTGKIVGLADAFDAMTSKRVYRDAMSIEHALDQIRKGLGTQFDEVIGEIFLSSDIYHLWDLIQDTNPGTYGEGQMADYGTAAIGTLLR